MLCHCDWHTVLLYIEDNLDFCRFVKHIEQEKQKGNHEEKPI